MATVTATCDVCGAPAVESDYDLDCCAECWRKTRLHLAVHERDSLRARLAPQLERLQQLEEKIRQLGGE